MMNATRGLAQFVTGLRFEALPPDVVARAKLCLADLIGVALVGRYTKAGRIAAGTALDYFGPGRCSIIGFEKRASVLGAVWANSSMGCVLDLDDGHDFAMGHPGSIIIPALLALAEERRIPGPFLIAALVAGYEGSVRISGARRLEAVHTYASGVWGAYAAALAAAKALDLDMDATVHALGIAGSHTPFRPPSRDYKYVPMLKECIPWASMTGTSAALLAERGYSGFMDLLDYEEYYRPEIILQGLGRDYMTLGVFFKPFSSCRWTHAAIEACLILRAAHGIAADDIKRITVHSFNTAVKMGHPEPGSTEDAQYSIPFVCAAALLDGEMGPEQVGEDRLHDPNVLALARRVTISPDPELESKFMSVPSIQSARVEIETGEEVFIQQVDMPLGHPQRPLSAEQVMDKFQKLAAPVLGVRGYSELRDLIMSLENLPDAGRIAGLLRKG